MRQAIVMVLLGLTMTGCTTLTSWWPWGDNDAGVTQIALTPPDVNRLPGIAPGASLNQVLALLGPPHVRWTPAGRLDIGGRWEWISPEWDPFAGRLQYRHRLIEFDAKGSVSATREWYTKEPPGAVIDAPLSQEALPGVGPPPKSTAPALSAERSAESPGIPPALPQPSQASTPPSPQTPDPPLAQPLSQTGAGPALEAEKFAPDTPENILIEHDQNADK
jgi:hypothetical protein